MTSINAIRFNQHQGAMVADESISTDGGIAYHVSDKVSTTVPEAIRDRYGLVAGLATTGSCAVGDHLKEGLARWVRERFEAETERLGHPPDTFPSLDDLMEALFSMVVGLKQQWFSDRLRGEFGFTLPEFLQGRYEREGQIVDLADEPLARRITDWLGWAHLEPEVGGIFKNAGLLAGYSDETGFQIYHFDFRDGFWERVQTCYFAEGSGRFSVDPAMYSFVEGLRVDQRRCDVDPVEGLHAILAGINSASDHEIGVGGYPTIHLFDGRRPPAERQREFTDDRSWLGCCIVRASTAGFLEHRAACELLEGVFYEDEPFESAHDRFWKMCRDPRLLGRLLRGYKLPARV